MAPPFETENYFLEEGQKVVAVLVTFKDGKTGISSGGYVISRSRKFDTKGSGHEAFISGINAQFKNRNDDVLTLVF